MKLNTIAFIRLAVLLGAFAAQGCFAYREVQASDVRAGASVKVSVDRETALELADQTGSLRTEWSGVMTDRSTDALMGLSYEVGGERFRNFVAIPWDRIDRVEQRQFSAVRSAGAAALMGIAAVLILSVGEGGDNDDGGEVPPINEQWRIPLLRFGF